MDIAELKSKLLTLDQVDEQLAAFEDLSRQPFYTDGGSQVHFTLPDGWNADLAEKPGMYITPAGVDIDGDVYPLTKDAVLEATSLAGIPKLLASKTPGTLIQNVLNYWMSNGSKYLQLVHNGAVGMAFTRASVNVTSNVGLLTMLLGELKDRFGGEVLADYKFQNDLHRTGIRLIVPTQTTMIASQRADEEGLDPWSIGLALEHSMLGECALSVHGYLFAWWCTNGAIAMEHSAATHRRRANEDSAETLEWAGIAAQSCLDEIEHELKAVAALPKIPLEGSMSQTTQHLFDRFKVPVDAREAVMQNLASTDDLSAYGVMNAVTQVANDEELSDTQVTELMRIGGAMPHVLSGMCDKCHRL